MTGHKTSTTTRQTPTRDSHSHSRSRSHSHSHTHPVLKGPAEVKSLTALLEKRVDAVLASLLVMSVYPTHVTPFGVLYT